MKWIYVYIPISILFNTDNTQSCELPSYMNGNWFDSKFIDVEFSNGNTMYLPSYDISRKGQTTNLTCYLNVGNVYVLRTTESIEVTVSDVLGLYYYYLCMDITQITEYSFYYYLQTKPDTNNERVVAFNESLSFDSITPFCNSTLDLKLFSVMVRNGFENNALQTCSTPLLGDFTFTLENSIGTTCISTGLWSFIDDSFSSLNISYTTGSHCETKIGLAENSNIGCLMCIQSDTNYYTALINLDTSDNKGFSSKFTCVVSSTDGNNVTFTQRGRLCDEQQTASELPNASPLHPFDSTSVIGALVYLVPTGQRTSKYANCFPRSTTTDAATDESSSNIILIVVVCIVVLLILVIIIVVIVCKCKLKNKKDDINVQAPMRKGRFLLTLRSALLAGMGISNKRDKPLIIENELTKENQTDKQPLSTEDNSTLQNVLTETPTVQLKEHSASVPALCPTDTTVNSTNEMNDTNEKSETENHENVSDINTCPTNNPDIPPEGTAPEYFVSDEKVTRTTGKNIDEQFSTTEHNNTNTVDSQVEGKTNENILDKTQTAIVVTNPTKSSNYSDKMKSSIETEDNEHKSNNASKDDLKITGSIIQPNAEPVVRTSGLSFMTTSTSIESFRSDSKDFIPSEFHRTDAESVADKKDIMRIDSSKPEKQNIPDKPAVQNIAENTPTRTVNERYHDSGIDTQLTLPNEVQNTDQKEKFDSSNSFHETVRSIHDELDNAEVTTVTQGSELPNQSVENPNAPQNAFGPDSGISNTTGELDNAAYNTISNQSGVLDNDALNDTSGRGSKLSSQSDIIDKTGYDNNWKSNVTSTADSANVNRSPVNRDTDHYSRGQRNKNSGKGNGKKHNISGSNDSQIKSVTPVQMLTGEHILPGQINSSVETKSQVTPQSKFDEKQFATETISKVPKQSDLKIEQSATDRKSEVQIKKSRRQSHVDTTPVVSTQSNVKSQTPEKHIISSIEKRSNVISQATAQHPKASPALLQTEKTPEKHIISSIEKRSNVISQPTAQHPKASPALLQTENSEKFGMGKLQEIKNDASDKESKFRSINTKEVCHLNDPLYENIASETNKSSSYGDNNGNYDLPLSNEDSKDNSSTKRVFTERNRLTREQTRVKLYQPPENVMKIQYERRYKTTVSLRDLIDQKKQEISKQVKKTKSPYHSKLTLKI